MNIWIILFIMFTHWVADFVLQSQEMSAYKSSSIYWLSTHASSYAVSMMFMWVIFTLFSHYGYINGPELPGIWLFFQVLFLIFISHGLIDCITSRITKKLWNKNKLHNFFVVIGFDQWLHLVQLLIIYKEFLI